MKSEVVDDFADTSSWMPVASGLAQLAISSELVDGTRSAMRLDFDFKGGGGFVVARKTLSRRMPESFTLSFAIRGQAPPNQLELKLADGSGHNVWWRHWKDFDFPADWRVMKVRSSEIEFAWGPAGGGSIADLGAIELAITAGPGGAGTIWISDLELEDRTYRGTPIVRASSAEAESAAALVLDGDVETSWLAETAALPHWLEIDFGEPRELGGLVVTWPPAAQPRRFSLEVSDDGAAWTTAHAAEPAEVARSYIYMPGAQCRFLRFALEARQTAACGIAEIAVQPFGFSRSIHEFFEHVAGDQPRGHHPRWVSGEQSYWTCIGLPDGNTSAIINEEGMVEVDRGTFSIEPFVYVDGRLLTWADADISPKLEDDWLPVPSSLWTAGDISLRTTAFAGRCAGRAILYLRYRLESAAARRATLFTAIRPFQVNPPWQAFGELGGLRKIERLAWDGRAVDVDGSRLIVPLTQPSGFGAAAFEQGEIPSYLARGVLPDHAAVDDAFGYASAALAFEIELAPGEPCDVFLAVPFGAAEASAAAFDDVVGEQELETTLRDWRQRFAAVEIELPQSVREYGEVARTAAAQILVNRDGPALQPGPRRYTRSWIRDGAVMATALMRLGRNDEAFEFIRWYATFQAPDGNVPCCVDRNGPDWLVEHDSHGELIFTIAECFRFTRDRDFLAEMWTPVQKALDYLDALRATRLGPEFDTAELRARRGLLPESASHEGYLAHPVHSYWDDFWALRAYRDAAELADALGDATAGRRADAGHAALGAALRASIERTISERSIAYVPGSVEWADFDPTATSVAVSLLGGVEDMPRAALEHTFDEYLAGFRRRRHGEIDWNNYSAYEVRIVGALVHLDRRDDAAELADFLLGDRRPRSWNQWPEISWRNPLSPGHIGDVPHTWIGAEYVLAWRSIFAYERLANRSLVLLAGVPSSWVEDGEEVGVAGLPTYYGKLDVHLRRDGDRALIIRLGGEIEMPAGGIILRPPLAAPLISVTVDGREATSFDAESATVRQCPAEVVLRF